MKKREVNSSRMPIYRDSGFELYDSDIASGAFKDETEHEREPDYYIYSRYRNPTVVDAEEEIMKLEGSAWALLTQSGMSAVDTALSVFQDGEKVRPYLFFNEIYGGTISYIDSILRKRRGLDIHVFSPANGRYDMNEFKKVLQNLKPEFVYLEAISNPMLIIPDAEEVIRISAKHGAKVIVDNTFATPRLWKPLESGAFVVIHSATKYLSGHGNLTAGVICGNDTGFMKEAIEYRKYVGHMISPDDAYRLHTQLKSFDLRFSQQCRNAGKLAEMLFGFPVVGKVLFPGLAGHPTYPEAVKLFGNKGFGAMVTFDFNGKNDFEKRRRRDSFIKEVSGKIKLIPTLGDPDTILLPVEAVWGSKYPEPGMIRVSAGFENWTELETTVRNAIHKIS